MLPLKWDVCLRPLRMCRHVCERERLFFFLSFLFFFFSRESASIYYSTQSCFETRKRSPSSLMRFICQRCATNTMIQQTRWMGGGGVQAKHFSASCFRMFSFRGVIATRCVSSLTIYIKIGTVCVSFHKNIHRIIVLTWTQLEVLYLSSGISFSDDLTSITTFVQKYLHFLLLALEKHAHYFCV